MNTTSRKPIATPKKGAVEIVHTDGDVIPVVKLRRHQKSRRAGPLKARSMQVKLEGRALQTRGVLESVTGVSLENRVELHKKVKMGLPYGSLLKLEEAYLVTHKEMAKLISIAPTTLTRRKKDGVLNTEESDRIARFAQIKDDALAMMQGDNKAALEWLRTPMPIFDDESPQEHSITEIGATDVRDLIGRIRHGVFS